MNTKIRGSILLIAGCSIGAGMLGIPVVTGTTGFIPGSLFFILTWAFMALSGLVLAELVLSYKEEGMNLLSLTQDTLGLSGKMVAVVCFMFLFYAIMTAYVLAASIFFHDVFGLNQFVASIGVVFAVYCIIARGMRQADSLNRWLMSGLVLCYVLLVSFGFSSVQMDRLLYADFSVAYLTLPILVVSFGYHNLIPSLATYLDRSKPALYRAISIGSLIPLGVYLLWDFVILGMVPMEHLACWKSAQNSGEMISQVLAEHVASAKVVLISQSFAFFAVATSFLPVACSFLDFLKDGLPSYRKKEYLIALFVLAPPLIASLVSPHLFLQALDFAGGFCAVILFGILPALVAYRRKRVVAVSHFRFATKPVLLFLLVGSLVILGIELLQLGGFLS